MTSPPLILVVDESPAIRSILAEFLAEEGYRVCTRGSVTEADVVTLAPDLVIIDRGLDPDGHPPELLRGLREAGTTDLTPVLLITGAIQQLQAESADLRALGVPVVLKPFDLEEVLGWVQTLLRQS